MSRDCPAPEPLDLVATVRQGEWAGWVREQLELASVRAPAGRDAPAVAVVLPRPADGECRPGQSPVHRLGGPPALPRGDLSHLSRRGRVDLLPAQGGSRAGQRSINDVRGFRGLRKRFWPLEIERPCPDWQGAALGLGPGEEA